MTTEAGYRVSKTPGAPMSPANGGTTLTLEELAEFIDSLEYDEAPAALAGSADCEPEQ